MMLVLTLLHIPSSQMPNPYIALFNDTNYVFNWNNSVNNKRMTY